MTHERGHDIVSFGPFTLYTRERRLERDGQAVKIGSRALDLLIALTERAGDVYPREDLLARIWPDTTVEESGLRVHIAGLRKAIGDGVGGVRYVTNVPGRGYSFVGQVIYATSPAKPAAQAAASVTKNLPSRLERIIGRDDAIRDVSEQLRAKRFVSVIGPGGMGKSTVAVAVAHALIGEFSGDVVFVDLGSVAGPLQVHASVASAVGLVHDSDDAAPALVAFLRDRRTLIVLDSCEHVMNAVAPFAERLCAGAAGVHVLVTSREALRVEGEHVYRLPSLAYPPESASLSAGEVLGFAAAQLFMERAAAGGARIALSDADAPLVADICRRLDGIALAIEFAASRVDVYGVRGTASLLENRFKLLWHGRRTAVPRHKTLSALLDWSYNLLDDLERQILRRLSTFVGYFSLDAVAACAADVEAERAVDVLGSLVDKSLISADLGGAAGVRYRLLDTTRAYAQAKIDEVNERTDAARRHATYVCGTLEQENRVGDGAHAPSLAEHLGNARAALEWCFSEQGDRALGARLASAVVPLFMELSLLRECCRWSEVALAALGDPDRGARREMNLQAALGVAAMFSQGNGPEVRAALDRGAALAGQVDDPHEQLRLFGALNILLTRTGEWRDALAIGERSEQVASRLTDDPAAHLLAEWMIGVSRHLLGDQIEAERRCRSALEPSPISRSTAILYFGFDHRIRGLVVLGRSLWLLGRVDEAIRVASQTVREAAAIRQPTTVAISLVYTSSVFLWSGDLDSAAEVIDRLIRHSEKHSLGPYYFVGLGLRGEVTIRGGDSSGIDVVQRAMEKLHAGRHDLLQTVFATAISEGQLAAGHATDAMRTIDEALALAHRRNAGASFDVPEMLRLKGRIYASLPTPDFGEAERSLQKALDCARQQAALGWELRAATTLASLWSEQSRAPEARALLGSTYAKFTQGFATADLRTARRVLDEL